MVIIAVVVGVLFIGMALVGAFFSGILIRAYLSGGFAVAVRRNARLLSLASLVWAGCGVLLIFSAGTLQ